MTKKERTPSEAQHVGLRLSPFVIERLDELCEVNKRRRSDLIELLIERAHDDYLEDSTVRINP